MGNDSANSQKRDKRYAKVVDPSTRLGKTKVNVDTEIHNMWRDAGFFCLAAVILIYVGVSLSDPSQQLTGTVRRTLPDGTVAVETEHVPKGKSFWPKNWPSLPVAEAQCVIKPRLPDPLPARWDPLRDEPLEFPVKGDASINYTTCLNVGLEQGINCTTEHWRAPLFWRCRFDERVLAALPGLDTLFVPDPERGVLLFDQATFSSLAWSNSSDLKAVIESSSLAGGLECRLEPLMTPSYMLLFDEWQRYNELESRRFPKAFQVVPGVSGNSRKRSAAAPVLAADTNASAADARPLAVFLPEETPQVLKTFSLAGNFPWIPCLHGEYEQNSLSVILPLTGIAFKGCKAQSQKPAQSGAGRGLAANALGVGADSSVYRGGQKPSYVFKPGLVSIDMHMKREIMRSELYDTAPHSTLVGSNSVSDSDPGASGYEIPGLEPGSEITRAYCEDIAGLLDAEVADVVAEKYLEEGESIEHSEWVNAPLTDSTGFHLSADLCTETWSRRFFKATLAGSGENRTFVFDAASTGPRLHNPWLRTVPRNFQCRADAILYGQNWLDDPESERVVTLEHVCLGSVRDSGKYRPEWTRLPLLGERAKYWKCKDNGHLFNRWVGVACSQRTESLLVSDIQDTERPVLKTLPINAHGETASGLFSKDKLTFYSMQCHLPTQTQLESRIRGGSHADVFCLDEYVREQAQKYFADNCTPNIKLTIKALWENATLLACSSPASNKQTHKQQIANPIPVEEAKRLMVQDETFPVLGCTYMTPEQIASSDLAWIEPNSDFGGDLRNAPYYSDKNYCINLKANDMTKRDAFLRVLVPVEAMDACGNTAPFSLTPAINGGERLVVSMSLVDTAVYGGYLTKSKYCPI